MSRVEPIDTDTRQLRRNQDGFYTAGRKPPCSHCSHGEECGGFRTQPMACPIFMPTLTFNDQLGMDRIFNTLRVGKSWHERLVIGQTVGLYDIKRKSVFGYAEVLYTTCGPILEILELHAKANHLMLDKDPEEAAELMWQWKRRNYGPRIIDETKTLAAIYLVRKSGPITAPSEQQF